MRNRHDSVMMAPTLDAFPPVRSGRRGRPRRRPHKLHADKAYDAKARREECRPRGIVPRIARRGIESSEKLGRHRRVGEVLAHRIFDHRFVGGHDESRQHA